MTFQISQRGKQYLKTAEILLRAAQTMTDWVVATQLEVFADDYERRAEKASQRGKSTGYHLRVMNVFTGLVIRPPRLGRRTDPVLVR